ncbi:MAG: sigma-70 family RNA polymerase sigma factor [Armatimonadia bacterium]|nr:sigma-70 family RNA polymerase sigma factor [Armatimonadia bacterium]
MAEILTDEEKLVKLAASCDDDAFCELRDRYQQHLRVLVARYAPSAADREDLFSEIVARLLADHKKALRRWEPIAPFGAYLTTIAVRHCLTWLSNRSRTPNTVTLSAHAPDADEHGLLQGLIAGDEDQQPERVLAHHERRRAMNECLMQLSDSDRLVLALRFDQGMTGPEIGRALGITPGAARQRIFKALRRLATILEDSDHDLRNA